MKQEVSSHMFADSKIGDLLAQPGDTLTMDQLLAIKNNTEYKILQAARDIIGTIGTDSFKKASKSGLKDIAFVKRALGSSDAGTKSLDSGSELANTNKPTRKVSSTKTINNSFYTTISQRGAMLKRGDSLANIAAKTLIMLQNVREEKIHRRESEIKSYRRVEDISKKEKKSYSKRGKKKTESKQSNFLEIGKFTLAAGLLLFPSIAAAGFGDMGKILESFSDKIKNILKPPSDLGGDVPQGVGDLSGDEEMSMEDIKKFISGRESKNDYNKLAIAIAGDKNLPSEFKNIDLSKMSIQEVINLQKRMLKSNLFPSSALGKYQFTKAALEDTASKTGTDLSTKYTPEVQEKFMDKMIKDEVSQIKSMNLPVTKSNVYMRHFAGPSGFPKLMNAPENAIVGKVLGPKAEAANPRLGRLTVGELKKDFSENKTSTAKAKVTTPVTTSTAGTNLDKNSRPVVDMANKAKVFTVVQQTDYHYMGESSNENLVLFNDTYEPKPELVTR